jgi:plastocyanin
MNGLVKGTVFVVFVGLVGCGGYSAGVGNPTTPAPTPAVNGDVMTINVIGVNGEKSFSPNPSTVPAGQKVVWHNADTVTHRVLLDDETVDTGNLPPGATSQPMTIDGSGGPYHCVIHPAMSGTVSRLAQLAPACEGAFCSDGVLAAAR